MSMTDKDIIKALGICTSEHLGCEDGCPYRGNCISNKGYVIPLKDALDLIKRLKVQSNGYRYKAQTQKGELARLNKQNAEQQAELEKLTVNMNAFGRGMQIEAEKVKTAKAEAIKEFAERVKQEINFPLAVWKVFDNLVKEMVGDAE